MSGFTTECRQVIPLNWRGTTQNWSLYLRLNVLITHSGFVPSDQLNALHVQPLPNSKVVVFQSWPKKHPYAYRQFTSFTETMMRLIVFWNGLSWLGFHCWECRPESESERSVCAAELCENASQVRYQSEQCRSVATDLQPLYRSYFGFSFVHVSVYCVIISHYKLPLSASLITFY